MALNLLEDLNAHLNANVFLRAFSFSSAQLPVVDAGKVQLANHLVLLDGIGFIFQLNERDRRGASRLTELEKWFATDVLKKGVRQIRQTRDLLRAYVSISLVNRHGHRVSVAAPALENLVGVILYRTPSKAPAFNPPRFKKTRVAGFVHVLRDTDYFGICEYLVTPSELLDYFRFRRELLSKPEALPPSVTEEALVGQYLFEEYDAPPDSRFQNAAVTLRGDRNACVFSYVIENLGTQIARRDADSAETTYYPILAEVARLGRSELRELKTQLRLSLEAVRAGRFELPYRIASAGTDCGFLILPGSAEFRLRARAALESLAVASKHELKMEKQVSLAMWRTGEIIDIEWMFSEGPNSPNPELDERLERNYPFRRTSEKRLPEYFL